MLLSAFATEMNCKSAHNWQLKQPFPQHSRTLSINISYVSNYSRIGFGVKIVRLFLPCVYARVFHPYAIFWCLYICQLIPLRSI